MQLVETITVGSGGAASIEFTSIPQDADDLLVLLSLRGSSFTATLTTLLNNSSVAEYGYVRLLGDGSAVSTQIRSARTSFSTGDTMDSDGKDTANTFNNIELYFANYTSSATKAISQNSVTENNGTTAWQQIAAGSWANSSAINQIKFTVVGGNFLEHSTASLYKIVKAA